MSYTEEEREAIRRHLQDADFWNDQIDKLSLRLSGELRQSFLTEVQKNSQGLSLSFDTLQQLAIPDILEHARLVAQQVTDTTKTLLENEVPLETVYSPERLERIAITENTFAHKTALVTIARAEKMDVVWVCDDNACDACLPYDGTVYSLTDLPDLPVHPHCRCRIELNRT